MRIYIKETSRVMKLVLYHPTRGECIAYYLNKIIALNNSLHGTDNTALYKLEGEASEIVEADYVMSKEVYTNIYKWVELTQSFFDEISNTSNPVHQQQMIETYTERGGWY